MISCASIDQAVLRVRKVFPLVHHDVHWDAHARAFSLTSTVKLHTGKTISHRCFVEDFIDEGQEYLDHVVWGVVQAHASYALEA